jgi:predicted DNA-binding protein
VNARKRFELRITDEDRQRLRALAEQQATTESGAIRALLRQAELATNEDSAAGKEERTAA